MFGLFGGNWAFTNEQEVNHKKLQIHPRVGEEGEKLLMLAFQRDEAKRCEASEAVKHPFLNQDQQMTEEESLNSFKLQINEFGADEAAVARRRELVDRRELAAQQYQ